MAAIDTQHLTTPHKPFYGWVIVGVGFLAQFITGIGFYGFSTYLLPLQKEFGWSKALIAGPRSLTQPQSALLGPLNGYLVDRFGARVMLALGSFIFGLGLILFASVRSAWSYYAVNLLMGLGSSFGSLIVISTVLNNWFERRRTMALGIATTGLAVAGVVGIPLVVWGQGHIGWRGTALWSGIAVWAIGIPAAFLLKNDPESHGLLPDGAPPGAPNAVVAGSPPVFRGFTLRQALHTRSFWVFNFASGFSLLPLGAIAVHQFAHMEEGIGLTTGKAALVITVMSVFNIGGRLFGGALGDMIPKRYLLAASMIATGIALYLFATASSIWPAIAFAVLFGTGWGIRTPVINSMQGEYFGRLAYGRIIGITQLVASPVSFIGPAAAGFLADRQGNYEGTLLFLAGFSMVTALLFALAAPPPRPEPQMR